MNNTKKKTLRTMVTMLTDLKNELEAIKDDEEDLLERTSENRGAGRIPGGCSLRHGRGHRLHRLCIIIIGRKCFKNDNKHPVLCRTELDGSGPEP